MKSMKGRTPADSADHGRAPADSADHGRAPKDTAREHDSLSAPETDETAEELTKGFVIAADPSPKKEPVKKSVGKGKSKKAIKRRRKKRILVACIVLGTLMLLSLLGWAALKIWTDAPNVEQGGLTKQDDPTGDKSGDLIATPAPVQTPTPTVQPDPKATPTPTQTPAPETAKTGRREGVYTVLVVGQDVAGMNTDTIMVARLDTVEKTLNVVSIPRDTLVNVSWAVKKVNSVYGMTGTEEGLVEGLSELLGFKVDSYAVVNIYAFEEIIDAIGGLDFEVPMHICWGDPTIGKSYDIPAGMQHLNGYNALGVVRFRKNTDGTGYPTGDIGRMETQQRFAVALAKKMLSLGTIPNLSKVISIVTDNLKTNLTSGNMAFYAQEFLKLDAESITISTMPYEPVYIKGGSYVAVRLGDWIELLNDRLNPYYENITEQNLDILTFLDGSFYSTTGVLAGGYDSFYDYMQ